MPFQITSLTGLKYEENGVKIQLTKKEGKVKVVSAPSMPQMFAPGFLSGGWIRFGRRDTGRSGNSRSRDAGTDNG